MYFVLAILSILIVIAGIREFEKGNVKWGIVYSLLGGGPLFWTSLVLIYNNCNGLRQFINS